MTNIVNLRQARKARARIDKARGAQANRAKFGRTKTQRLADAALEEQRAGQLNGAFREGRTDQDKPGEA